MYKFCNTGILRGLIATMIICLVSFKIAAQPVISSFSPSSGPAGTAVTITGTGFNATAANNIVFFGAAKANVTNATATTLTVIAPMGATYEPITVTINNLTGYSAKPFQITFGGGTVTPASFSTRTDFTGAYWDHMLLKDFDLDGMNDVISVDNYGMLAVFRNTTSSAVVTLAPKADIAAITSKKDVIAADIDGDGKQDIIISGGATNNVISIHKNTSTAGSISFAPAVDFTMGDYVDEMKVADIDRDGKPDILAATYSGSFSDRISILRNTTTGGVLSFASQFNVTALATNQSVYGFTVGDFDGDAKVDIALIHSSTPSVITIYKNNSTSGSFAFAAGTSITLPPLSSASLILSADMDNDNKQDLIVVNSVNEMDIYVLTNTSASSISFASPVIVEPYNSWSPHRMCVSDINGDGKLDFVYSEPGGDYVGVLENTSTGGNITFAPGIALLNAPNPVPITVGDMNNDGKPEILVSGVDAGPTSTLYLTVYTNGVVLMPVDLLSFNLQHKGGKVLLQWSTVSEKNTDRFDIEHSINGSVFSRIGSVKAAANSNVKKEYPFLHEKPVAGWNYYRLKMIDTDGKFTYSNIIRTRLNHAGARLHVYPNPSHNLSIVEHPSLVKGIIIISDITGKVVRTINIQPNTQQTMLDMKALIGGIYTITLISEDEKLSTSLIVK